ncbi:MAG: LysR family transcriptional regulator [Parahaliea sp.]
MDTQNLLAFLQVAQDSSFSQAAQRLHLTQPAVSKRIAQLEQQLNSRLFDRIGRQVELTEAGRALLPHARTVIQQLDMARQAVQDLTGEVSGKLRLATSHHIGLHRLPPVLSAFKHNFTAVQVDIEFMDSEQAYDLIHQGRAELAIVTLAPVSDSSIISRSIWPDPLDIMVCKTHPLAGDNNSSLSTLATYPAVLPGLNTYTGQIVKALFDQHALPLQVSMATNYLETIRMLAAVGLGWTVLPRSMGDGSLQALTVKGITIERTLGVIYHQGRSLSRAAQAFLTVLESVFLQSNPVASRV